MLVPRSRIGHVEAPGRGVRRLDRFARLAREVQVEVRPQLPAAVGRDRGRGEDVRRLEREEPLRTALLGRGADDVLDRSGWTDPQDLEEGRYREARRGCAQGAGRSAEEVATALNARTLRHASSSASKSFAKQNRSSFFPRSDA